MPFSIFSIFGGRFGKIRSATDFGNIALSRGEKATSAPIFPLDHRYREFNGGRGGRVECTVSPADQAGEDPHNKHDSIYVP